MILYVMNLENIDVHLRSDLTALVFVAYLVLLYYIARPIHRFAVARRREGLARKLAGEALQGRLSIDGSGTVVRAFINDDCIFYCPINPKPEGPGHYVKLPDGLLRATAYLIEDGKYKGLSLIFVNPDMSCRITRNIGVGSEYGDRAFASTSSPSPGIVEVEFECELVKAKSAELYFDSYKVFECNKSGKYKATFDFRGIDEPILVIAHGYAEGKDVLQMFNSPIAGLCSDFRINIQLVMPDGKIYKNTGVVFSNYSL